MTRLEYGIARVRGDLPRDFPTRAMSGGVDMKFGERLNAGIEGFKANAVALIVGMLLASIVSIVSLGILAGPMFVGLCGMALKAARKQTTEIGDVFEILQKHLVPAIILGLVLSVVFFVGGVIPAFALAYLVHPLLAIPVYLLAILLIAPIAAWSYYRMADKREDFKTTLLWTVDLLKRDAVNTILTPIAFMFPAVIVGAILCGIGQFVTVPIAYIAIAKAYEDTAAGGKAAV